ncbi:hypothetical protein LRS03_12725 [Rhizobacter sp. J219]|uniref:hypothetical protein n=1 Tax=Rhizobacter sp. J219 TaxID=2898430 RepID=UPI002150E30C|nr:hypothetical protein [Rhizobacter sp. J219]MCR5883674.1 hypothetical protein [Rhizobacter sp. J219]
MNWIATHPWAYPALETLHLVGVALLVGNLVLFEIRVWGLQAALPLRPLARLSLGLALAGFALAATSGGVMLASQWVELQANRALWLKAVLVIAAGANAAAFHLRGGLDKLDRVARWQTALSMGLWLLVVACGRFIAYV